MSVRSESKAPDAASAALSILEQAQTADSPTAEGNAFNIASPENPLTRNVVVSIKASLNDFCLQKTRATWAPSQEALRSICEFPAPVHMHTHTHTPTYLTNSNPRSTRSPAAPFHVAGRIR